MSGSGKSTVLAALQRRGFDVIDTDERDLTVWSTEDGGYVWREDEIADVLEHARTQTLYVAGCVSNQRRFYRRFEAVVLLSAPAEVLLDRIADRTTNDYGKTDGELDAILRDLAEVEPLLRATCTHEIDATKSVDEVVTELVAIGSDAGR
jgi:dephospho-CoA kinase